MKIGEKIGPVRLNIRVLADELNALGCDFSSRTVKDTFSFSSMCIYDDQNELSHDYVYYLPKDHGIQQQCF